MRPPAKSPSPVLTRAGQQQAASENERAMLVDALNRASGDVVSEAAGLIGYSRSQFYRLLKKHHINI
jgi:transcriptional regulator of acetoin/glycerol metabolism